MARVVRDCAADGILWFGPGDDLVRLLAVRPASRDWLADQAQLLIDAVSARAGARRGPAYPDIDCDEETTFSRDASPPDVRELRVLEAGETVLGGFVLYAASSLPEAPRLLDEAARALTVAFLVDRLRRKLDDASDRMKELAEVGRIFTHAGDPERTLNRILDMAIRASAAQVGAIVHFGRDGELAAVGMRMEQLRSIRFVDGADAVERAVVLQREIVMDRARLAEELAPDAGSPTLETLALLPLIHEGRSRGALVLVNVPESFLGEDPLVAMLATIARLAAAAITAEERQRERLEEERTRQELRAARTIQQSLIPRALPDVAGVRMHALWRPSRALGGDFYDIFPLGEGRLGVVIADVSGKGLPAALLMAVTRSYLRVLATARAHPGEVLAGVNARLAREIADNRFVTATYIVIDVPRRSCVLANAGHHAPALVTSRGRVEYPEGEGLPLGIFEEAEYPVTEVALDPDQVLVLYTDGLLESRVEGGELLGRAGLTRLLVEGKLDDPKALLERLWAGTMGPSVGRDPGDDWTALAISFRGA